ncbi:MFS transporter [Dongia soli]|uniref:MFS transporter n=1 Tax=Dongia soli TaxID=600628 RepID=A0ABU5EHW2_9PROT|nr:MFS transporter [Dongia soli]MDY0885619.1 MFS transporter [Dongia soli]
MQSALGETLEMRDEPVTWTTLLFGPKARITWTINIGVSLQAFGWFLVSTIMPSVVLQLGKPELLSWGTTAFLALSIPGAASAGFLKGRFGTRRMLILSGLVVIAANLLGLASPNMEIFLLARALQGLGEGMVMALCYILVGEALAPKEVNPAFGILAVVWALATLIGPSLAGLLTAWISWRIAFVPMALLALTFLILVASDRAGHYAKASNRNGLPLGRLLILGIAISAVSFAGATRDVPRATTLIILTLSLIALCFYLDRRSAQRLFPRNLLSLANPSTLGVWIIGLMFGAEAGPPIYMTYFVQVGYGHSVFFSGQFAAIVALAWSASAIYVSRIGQHLGRTMLIVGPACLAIGLSVLVFWHMLPLAIGGLALAVIGCGFGLSYGFYTENIIGTAKPEERDVTSGAIPTLESICAAVGAALAGLLGNAAGFGGFGATDIPAAVPITVFGVSALVAFGIVLCALRFRRLIAASA